MHIWSSPKELSSVGFALCAGLPSLTTPQHFFCLANSTCRSFIPWETLTDPMPHLSFESIFVLLNQGLTSISYSSHGTDILHVHSCLFQKPVNSARAELWIPWILGQGMGPLSVFRVGRQERKWERRNRTREQREEKKGEKEKEERGQRRRERIREGRRTRKIKQREKVCAIYWLGVRKGTETDKIKPSF